MSRVSGSLKPLEMKWCAFLHDKRTPRDGYQSQRSITRSKSQLSQRANAAGDHGLMQSATKAMTTPEKSRKHMDRETTWQNIMDTIFTELATAVENSRCGAVSSVVKGSGTSIESSRRNAFDGIFTRGNHPVWDHFVMQPVACWCSRPVNVFTHRGSDPSVFVVVKFATLGACDSRSELLDSESSSLSNTELNHPPPVIWKQKSLQHCCSVRMTVASVPGTACAHRVRNMLSMQLQTPTKCLQRQHVNNESPMDTFCTTHRSGITWPAPCHDSRRFGGCVQHATWSDAQVCLWDTLSVVSKRPRGPMTRGWGHRNSQLNTSTRTDKQKNNIGVPSSQLPQVRVGGGEVIRPQMD